jgi:hypothetical protein
MTRRPATFAIAVLLVVLCASVAIIVRQGHRILDLESVLNSPVRPLPEGISLDPFEVQDLSGKPHLIQFGTPGSKPTVLYVFRPGCSWCRRNSRNIALLASHAGGLYNFIGLSLTTSGLDEFIRRNNVQFPVYVNIPSSVRARYRLGSTPETIVVSSNGTVLKSWSGAYTQEPIKSDVERFFALQLPSTARLD